MDLHLVQSRFRARVGRRGKARDKRRKKERSQPAASDHPTVGGVVVEIAPGSATVITAGGQALSAALAPEVRQRQQTALAVGDDVVVARDPAGIDQVIRVGPRRTHLSRRDPQNRHRDRVVVANVDTVVVVGSAADPPLRPRLVDRYLVAIGRGGSRPLVVINKVDLVDTDRRSQLDATADRWRAAGIEVRLVSASSGDGLPELVDALAGQRCAFVGHSGVGKSSLVTALGSAALAGDLADHGRGRHTTSTATLHRLPSGTEVIDTPGVRQFALCRMTIGDLRGAFTEFAPLASDCGYADCTHDHEADCAVRSAVEAGTLSAGRYDSYLRLLAQLG